MAVLVAALVGCSERERANPFDPRNGSTHGSPIGFAALAGDARVDLKWQDVHEPGLLGYDLLRRAPGDSDFTLLVAGLPPNASAYADRGLQNGLDHSYRLFYVFDRGRGGRPAEETATPGPARPWVADAGQAIVVRLTPDGRHVAFVRAGFQQPVSVAVDSVSGQVWVADGLAGTLTAFDPSSGVRSNLPGFVAPGALAVSAVDHSAWLCDEQAGKVHHFSATLMPILNPIEPLGTPIGIALDPWDGSVWICERGANRVRRYTVSHTFLWSVSVYRPSRVAVDSLTRSGWMTSFEAGRVVRVAPTGVAEDTIAGFAGPIGIAVDPRRGRIWIADARAGAVVAVDRAGSQITRVTGLPEVRDVAVELESGDVWAAVPGMGQVVQLSPTGQILRRLGGFSAPYSVDVTSH